MDDNDVCFLYAVICLGFIAMSDRPKSGRLFTTFDTVMLIIIVLGAVLRVFGY